jgi:hypothetical protein
MKEPTTNDWIARVCLHNLPPRISAAVVTDGEMAAKFGLQQIEIITVGSDGPSFTADMLHKAVHVTLETLGPTDIADKSGAVWTVTAANDTDGKLIRISNELRTFDLGNETVFDQLHLSREDFSSQWVGTGLLGQRDVASIFGERDHVDMSRSDVQSALRNTPGVFAHHVVEILQGPLGLSDLVPGERRYYERLLGVDEEPKTLAEAVAMIEADTSLDSANRNDFKWRLLRAAQSEISLASVRSASSSDAIALWGYLDSYWSLFSAVGLIENSIRLSNESAELSARVMIELDKLLVDDPETPDSIYRVASTLILLSESIILQSNALVTSPPYFRRWAAMTHAGLLEATLRHHHYDVAAVADFIERTGGSRYFFTCLLDLPAEPRWMPEYISAEQLKNEVICRLYKAGINFLKPGDALYEKILGKSEGSVATHLVFPGSHLAGPLEGGTEAPNDIPNEMLHRLVNIDESSPFDPTVFAGLVNCCSVFRITREHSALARRALSVAKKTVAQNFDSQHRLSLVLGLARVANFARDPELASEVRILSRIARRLQTEGYELEEVRVLLTAAGAHETQLAWVTFVDDWLLEMAREAPEETRHQLADNVYELFRYRPELAGAFSRTIAFLESL